MGGVVAVADEARRHRGLGSSVAKEIWQTKRQNDGTGGFVVFDLERLRPKVWNVHGCSSENVFTVDAIFETPPVTNHTNPYNLLENTGFFLKLWALV